MSAEPPSRADLAAYAARQHLHLDEDELERELTRVAGLLDVLRRLDDLEAPTVPLRHPRRDAGRPPSPGEDPFDAVVRFCDVEGADTGPLAGMRLGVKDTIAVAGVPMTGEEPVTPAEDAVVVERLLDAGARIVAKTTVDDQGRPFPNPRNPRFIAGGSSSGSAAAVAAGLVDAALGGDQGGSIRIPAAWCGIVGMKATHGLVPSHGLAYWDHTLDHIGPMTATVAENATVLRAIAGGDWRDPQWVRTDPVARDYPAAAGRGVEGLRIGVVAESLAPAGCTAPTIRAFEDAEDVLARGGAEVVPVSVPLWGDAYAIWLGVVTASLSAMSESFGQGYGHLGRVDVEVVAGAARRYWQGRRTLPFGGRSLPLVYEHVRRTGTPFGHAQNLRIALRGQVSALLEDLDLLITPTVPSGPPLLTLDERERPLSIPNTYALNLTGHPALTVPSGTGDDDMPAGLQIIGRPFDEATVYRAAFAFEAR